MEMEKPVEKSLQPEPGKSASTHMFAREITYFNIALVIQFLLGMYVNLYVTFPTSGPADAWAYAWHKWPVGVHIILGTLILLGGISLLVRAIRPAEPPLDHVFRHSRFRSAAVNPGWGRVHHHPKRYCLLPDVGRVPDRVPGVQLGAVHPIAVCQ